MKAWYDDIDSATLQRIKTYSAFNDAMSKNLMVQTMYEYREKEVQDFKETNHELTETCIARKKRIAELEKEISILLSCNNCPENKGSYICQKEYEDKCLSQKIQYIKELQEENAELNKKLSKAEADYDKMFWNKNEIISKAKELLRMVIDSYFHKERFSFEKDLRKAEQFLKEE